MTTRDWLLIDAKPWRSREELEAKLDFYVTFAELQTEKLIEALHRLEGLGRPLKAVVGKRQARQRRAKPPKPSPWEQGFATSALAAHNTALKKKRRQ